MFQKLKFDKFTTFPKLKFMKLGELKVLVNLFKYLKSKEFNKELMFMLKIIKLFKNMIDLIIKNFIVLLDTEIMVESLLITWKEIQKNLVVLLVAGLFGDF